MTVAYLLFRVSDYLEDNTELEGKEKAALLRLWDQVLSGASPGAELEQALDPLAWDDSEAETATPLSRDSRRTRRPAADRGENHSYPGAGDDIGYGAVAGERVEPRNRI